MKNDFKIYQIIGSLNPKEVRQIRKMLKSPFFTRREDMNLLFESLLIFNKKGIQNPNPKVIFKKTYPKSSWDYLKLRGTMSDLIELIEECWMINYWRADRIKNKLVLSRIYRSRNLAKSFSSSVKKINNLLENQPKKNADYYQNLLQIQTERMKYQSTTKRTEDLFLQEISDTNDTLYLIQKLQTTCAQLSHQLVRKTAYHYGLLHDLLDRIDQERYLKIPAIAIYYYCFKFLTEKENLIYFQKFKILLQKNSHHFSKADLEAPYRLAINFCIRKTNEGVSSFIRESWNLYKEGLEEGILLENSYIPRFTFNNAIAAAIRLNELDWIENFIENYSQILESTFRDQTISFNLARLEFARKNFNKALLHLQSSEYKDKMNNMISKIILIKIYTELKEFESLDSHLDSFEQYIRRNDFSDYHKVNILNIIKYSRRIIAQKGYSRKEKSKIKLQISAETILSEKEWLLEKL